MHYYNENDPEMAAWLKELIREGWLADGWVDRRDIRNVRGEELREFVQCHFFAGIGGWPFALRLAGWPDGAEAWTGSCPCQPFSCAGKRRGTADERHLWPAFRGLIEERRPAVAFGEQVASADGRVWIAGVRADLEGMGYEVGAADLCAAGVSAPMVSQRLHWVAASDSSQRAREWISVRPRGSFKAPSHPGRNGEDVGMAASAGKRGNRSAALQGTHGRSVAQAVGEAYHGHWWSGALQVGRNCIEKEVERGGRRYRAQWRVKPGLSLLADGVPGRVAQLRGFGNAIVPQLAAEFVRAYCEAGEGS